MKIHKYLVVFLIFIMASLSVLAQDDLDDLLDSMEKKEEPKTQIVRSAFKSVRIINLSSTEMVAPGTMEFRISHRFASFKNDFFYNFFGLDQAQIRLSFAYGINNWLMAGIGRSTYQKTYDAYIKASILKQSTGQKAIPVSLLYFGSIAINTLKHTDETIDYRFVHRLAYTHQLIIGRKFNKKFSLALLPTVLHRNVMPLEADANTLYALGIGGRYKLTNRLALNAEYIFRLPVKDSPTFDSYNNSFSVGVDLETGGHVFQLHLSSSTPLVEKGYIGETEKSWFDFDIHFGFNITRQFTLDKKAAKKW